MLRIERAYRNKPMRQRVLLPVQHRAMMPTVPAATGRKSGVRILRQCEQRRNQRKREGRKQQDGEKTTHRIDRFQCTAWNRAAQAACFVSLKMRLDMGVLWAKLRGISRGGTMVLRSLETAFCAGLLVLGVAGGAAAIHGRNGVELGPPPEVAIKPVRDVVGGHTITDNYRWLEDQNSSATRAFLKAQM